MSTIFIIILNISFLVLIFTNSILILNIQMHLVLSLVDIHDSNL